MRSISAPFFLEGEGERERERGKSKVTEALTILKLVSNSEGSYMQSTQKGCLL